MDSPIESMLQEATVETKDSPWYFPLENGKYEVKPGLMPLVKDLCNANDSKVFQIDSNYNHYRQVKLAARGESLAKYYQTYNYSKEVASAIARLIITRLIQEHPQYFNLEQSEDTFKFHNQLTQETLYIDKNWELLANHTSYTSTLDALAAQVQEDLTVISRAKDGSNWLSAVHLCFPNHWSAQEKIGKDFATVHAPVAGMEKINSKADGIVNTMINRKPMVRFAWGLSTDTRLNHHPEPPPNISTEQWHGRRFNLDNPRLYLRIERQVIWGLPEYAAALFTIRTYFRDCQVIKQDTSLQSKLIAAIKSMTLDSLRYKGLIESKNSILEWLGK
jgi:hypothetical protein